MMLRNKLLQQPDNPGQIGFGQIGIVKHDSTPICFGGRAGTVSAQTGSADSCGCQFLFDGILR